MIVKIKEPSGDSQTEWALIELNGELIVPTDTEGRNELELGALRFTPDGVPVLIVGTHEIKGKVENLKNDFAILKKVCHDTNATESNIEYEVSGIVKKKLLFNQYPKTIMRS